MHHHDDESLCAREGGRESERALSFYAERARFALSISWAAFALFRCYTWPQYDADNLSREGREIILQNIPRRKSSIVAKVFCQLGQTGEEKDVDDCEISRRRSNKNERLLTSEMCLLILARDSKRSQLSFAHTSETFQNQFRRLRI